ncbi:MAG: DNA repair protein RecN [Lachnospiraceae bacterium]|nr:DNA repair protein RecN [Lachnospiraceae bacterium]
MLVSLSVKNLALIDVTEVEFKEGLNILTGETGAGKSILIGSINLALGERADKDIIRTGADHALIELLFEEDSLRVKKLMEELELPWEDGAVLISRKMKPERSVFRINGETVTTKQVKRLSEFLLDIHGQHEHQSLLHKKKHREILDGYAGEALAVLFPALKESWQEMSGLKKELAEAALDEDARLRELSLARFEVEEIENARIRVGEDEELENAYRKMTHSRRIMESISAVCRLTGAASDEGAAEFVGHALRELTSVSGLDEELEGILSQLEQVEELLQDFNRDVLDYQEKSAFSEEDIAETEERLNVLNHLKSKYGKTLEAVLEYQEKREEELKKLSDFDVYKENLKKRLREAEEEFDRLCGEASLLRREAAAALEKELAEALLDLNFMHVDFRVVVESGEKYRSALGCDDVEFMISTNVGEEVRPLSMVASGGELSRIMLGLKTVLADRDAVETLIFDEIDAGISGKTAWKVSEKLGMLSKKRQVICITHLPQIAAQADAHFYIEKSAEDGVTKTSITPLAEEKRIPEIARMLGGEEISPAALQNAEDLIKMAKSAVS